MTYVYHRIGEQGKSTGCLENFFVVSDSNAMNLFKYDDIVEDENGLTDGQIKKKKMRKKSQRLENEPIFKGKVNLSMEDLNGADEVWLVKVPKMVSVCQAKIFMNND